MNWDALNANLPWERVKKANKPVAPNNVARLLLGAGAPRSLDVFKIDIDSYDIFVVEAMLRNGTFRPKVIVMEIVRFAHPPSRAWGKGGRELTPPLP